MAEQTTKFEFIRKEVRNRPVIVFNGFLNKKAYMKIHKIAKDFGREHGIRDVVTKVGTQWAFFLNGMDEEKVKNEIAIPIIKQAFQESNKGGKFDEVIKVLDDLMIDIQDDEADPEISDKDRNEALAGLKDFKRDVVASIEDDERFKDIINKVMNTTRLFGQDFSIDNKFLINAQRPDHGIVMNRDYWRRYMKRTIKKGAKPILIKKMEGEREEKSGAEKAAIEKNVLSKSNVAQKKDLPAYSQVGLDAAQKDKVINNEYATFPLTIVWDEADTEQMPGEDDHLAKTKEIMANTGEVEDVFEENVISDKVRPLYGAIIEFATDNNLNIEVVNVLNDDDPNSHPKKIKILENAGNDVSLTAGLVKQVLLRLLPEPTESNISKQGQAAIGTWIVMHKFNFNIKYLKINHEIVVGSNQTTIIKIIDSIAKFMTKFIASLNQFVTANTGEVGNDELTEDGAGNAKLGGPVSPEDVADALGITDLYNDLKRQQQLAESLRSGVAKLK